MATLFDRVSGKDGEKIPLHFVQACLSEIMRGGMTKGEADNIMGLTTPQATDLQTVLTNAQSATDAIKFSSRVFNYLILAEMGEREYLIESAFWTMVAAEGAK